MRDMPTDTENTFLVEFVVPSAPQNLTSSDVGKSWLKVTWKAPFHPNGGIIGYFVRWEMVKDDNNKTVTNPKNESKRINNRELNITGLGK